MTTAPASSSMNAEEPQAEPKSASMQQADTANGENPDNDPDQGAPSTRQSDNPASQRTGERQANKNLENDPPA